MVYNLSYRRPAYVSTQSQDSLSGDTKQKSIEESIRSSSTCTMSQGIPDALSFDRIISGGTCPPCTLRDFMNYLKYIELSAENLQFFLWLTSYTKRFESLPKHEQELSPEWTISATDMEAATAQQQTRQLKVSAATAVALKGTGLESGTKLAEAEKQNPFYTPPRMSEDDELGYGARSEMSSMDDTSHTLTSSNNAQTIRKKAGDAYDEAGLKWQPFTIQPFRDEVARVITIYIIEGGSRQLNLSSKERNTLLHALENTTHPSAFHSIAVTVEWSLRCQAHPNFIRWTICNGNRPRVFFARALGLFCIIGGILTALLITLSTAGRAWRVLALVLFFLGISTLIAAWKGMCVVLHGMHHRHLRPWELFQDDDDNTVELKNVSLDTLDTYHSFESEPWVAKYEKRNFMRKIFDRETWVEEPALRQIQDTIFMQAVLGGIIGGGILTAIFVAVPKGHFY